MSKFQPSGKLNNTSTFAQKRKNTQIFQSVQQRQEEKSPVSVGKKSGKSRNHETVSKLENFYENLLAQTVNNNKGRKEQKLIGKIDRSLEQQKKIHEMLKDYIYVYKYCKNENEELAKIVKESQAAVNDIKQDLMSSDKRIDDDVIAKYQKQFTRKLKIWH